MSRADLAVSILDQMQMLDKEVPPARSIAEKSFDLVFGARIDLTALRNGSGAPASSWMVEALYVRMMGAIILVHCAILFPALANTKTSGQAGWLITVH